VNDFNALQMSVLLLKWFLYNFLFEIVVLSEERNVNGTRQDNISVFVSVHLFQHVISGLQDFFYDEGNNLELGVFCKRLAAALLRDLFLTLLVLTIVSVQHVDRRQQS